MYSIEDKLHTAFSGQTAVVLGGSGFIGREIVRRLASLGAKVKAVTTRLSHAYVLASLSKYIEIVQADLRHYRNMKEILSDAEYLFSFAGISGATDSERSPKLDLDINGRGILNVLEVCRKFNPNVRIIFPGSRLQYGKPHYLPVDESHPMNPISVYGIHKLLGEKYHLLYHRNYGLQTTVLRISNVYGPDEREDRRTTYNIVNHFVRVALAGGVLRIFGTGTQLRDYIYVRDLVEAVLLVAQEQNTVGQVYNLGSGDPVRFVDMARTIVTCAGQGRIIHQDWPPDVQIVETGDFYLSIDRLVQAIKWQPTYSLKQGIADTIETLRLISTRGPGE